MTGADALYAAAILSAAFWLPVMARFWQAWRSRRNPISLAILALVAFEALLHLTPFWLLPHEDGGMPMVLWIVGVNEAVGMAVCANFYLAFRLARRFHDERDDDLAAQPPVDLPGVILPSRVRRVLARHGCGSCEDCASLMRALGMP